MLQVEIGDCREHNGFVVVFAKYCYVRNMTCKSTYNILLEINKGRKT
jgi:hypothetical protein